MFLFPSSGSAIRCIEFTVAVPPPPWSFKKKNTYVCIPDGCTFFGDHFLPPISRFRSPHIMASFHVVVAPQWFQSMPSGKLTKPNWFCLTTNEPVQPNRVKLKNSIRTFWTIEFVCHPCWIIKSTYVSFWYRNTHNRRTAPCVIPRDNRTNKCFI